MVEIVDPRPDEALGDPACGTAGFLITSMEYLMEKYTSPEAVIMDKDGNKTFTGDLLVPYMDHIQNNMLNGFDFDVTMLRISAMNQVRRCDVDQRDGYTLLGLDVVS